MSWRTTAVLLVIVLALAAFLFFQNQQEPAPLPTPTTPSGTPTPEPVSFFSQAFQGQINELSIKSFADNTTIVYTRDDEGTWSQTAPVTATISVDDNSTIDTRASGLTNLRSSMTLNPEANPLSAYGLDAPDYEINLVYSTGDGVSLSNTIIVGNLTPIGNDYYIQQVDDPNVYIAAVGLIDNLIDLYENPPVQEDEPVTEEDGNAIDEEGTPPADEESDAIPDEESDAATEEEVDPTPEDDSSTGEDEN